MAETGERKMYHLIIRRTDGTRTVPIEILAESEEAAKAHIPADFAFVRFADRYYWPEEDALPDDGLGGEAP